MTFEAARAAIDATACLSHVHFHFAPIRRRLAAAKELTSSSLVRSRPSPLAAHTLTAKL